MKQSVGRLHKIGAWRWLLHLLVWGLALVAGCYSPAHAMYGSPVLKAKGDPKLTITDFSYTPNDSIKIGDTVKFEVTINKAYTTGNALPLYIHLDLDPTPGRTGLVNYSLPTNDDGVGGDAVAGDLIYSTELLWLPDYGTVEDLPIIARIGWDDGTPVVKANGTPLTVTEPEAAAQ
jgi:hypothetical protein